jgi:signal transduction histidine kinase
MGIGLLLVLPTLVTTFLGLNLVGFDTSICESLENENVVFYTYVAQFIFILATLHLGISKYRTATVKKKKDEILLATVGVTLFLLFFFLANFFVLILINYTIIDYAYNFAIYGLFGMPILLAYLTYLIVKYQAFNVKLIAAQALVFGVVVLIGSEFFFVSSTSNIILVGVTFVLACIGGYFLVRSVKNEVEQKEQIEKLAKNLEHANERLKILDRMKSEFVSIASHQLRSPLTAIRGYASMLLEGSYGVFPPKAREAITKIDDSSRYMALSIEDYLNVSRIESGNMKYEIGDFNLKEVAEKVVDEMRPIALKKGLLMVFRSDCNGSCSVNADIGKTRQVITNLIDNAMKYTPKGSIDVVAHDDMKKKKMYVTIKDTGVGMSKETQGEVFEKFTRAKNANRINVTGTGLGLFVAKKMVQEMGGRVWAESEGEGKGSTFHIELPLLPGAFK